MVRQYPVKAGARRWPVAVFYNILDVASINAFMLYEKRTGDEVSRRDFLFKLAAALRKDYDVERSSRNATISRPHSLLTALKNSHRAFRMSCICDNANMKLFQFCVQFLPFPSNKTVFVKHVFGEAVKMAAAGR